MSHASMHYKYLQISRVCSLFNRRRRRHEVTGATERQRVEDCYSVDAFHAYTISHVCACTRGRCSDRMLSMHHVAARSHGMDLGTDSTNDPKRWDGITNNYLTRVLFLFVLNSLIRLIWNYCYRILIIVFIHFDLSNEEFSKVTKLIIF